MRQRISVLAAHLLDFHQTSLAPVAEGTCGNGHVDTKARLVVLGGDLRTGGKFVQVAPGLSAEEGVVRGALLLQHDVGERLLNAGPALVGHGTGRGR